MKKKQTNGAIWFVFIVYCIAMLWLLFDRPADLVEGLSYEQLLRQNINIRPFFTIRNYLYVLIHRSNDAIFRHCLINLLGNILLFVPGGLMLPLLRPKQRKYPRFFFTCFGVILLVETAQLLSLRGSFDVDDIILNLLGLTLGFIIYQITKNKL